MNDSKAVKMALAHIDAWSNHDWTKTRELLATEIHAVVTSTVPGRETSDFTGIDVYMERKKKVAQLVQPGSVIVLSTVGDAQNAMTLIKFKIALGPAGSLVTMVRACLYMIDENLKIKEERDQFFLTDKM